MRRLGIVVLIALGAVAALLLSRAAAERRAAARAAPDSETPRPSAASVDPGERPRPDLIVRVQVLDAATRRPIVGATVESGAASATTGADGYASLTIDRDEGLLAYARGFVPERFWPDPDDEDLWIPLRPGIPVTGRVIHADGTPALRAEVKVERIAVAQDERGYFEIPGVPPGEEVRVWAGEEGYHPAEISFWAKPDRTSFEIVLGSGRACEGVVLDEERRPVAGARVAVVELWHDRTAGCYERASCRTDEKGRFSILGLPPLYPCIPQCGPGPRILDDRHRVRATTADFRAGETETFTADPEAPPYRCEIVVRPSAHVVATVAYPDGKREACASVRFGHDDAEHRPPDEYWSGPVAPGQLEITVGVRGWAERTFAVDVKPGVRNDVTIRLEEGLGLAGTVVDSEGRPLGNVSVEFDSASTETLADGTFRLHGLSAEEGTLDLYGDGYIEQSLDVRPGQEPVRVVLDHRVPKVRGRIDPPPLDRRVHVSTGEIAYVDRDGRFEVSAPVGKQRLRIEVKGSTPWVFTDIETAPGTTVDLGVLRMYDGVMVKGVVVDRDGAPIGYATVQAVPATFERSFSDTTDERGRFVIPDLPDAPITLDVQSRGHIRRAVEVERPAERQVTIVLEPGGTLDILGATEPVTLEPLDGGECRTLRPDEWHLDLPPGRYRVAGRIVEITVGETTDLDLGK